MPMVVRLGMTMSVPMMLMPTGRPHPEKIDEQSDC